MEIGYEDTVFRLTSLITAFPPPFIYIHDPITPHLLAPALRSALARVRDSSNGKIRYASIDAIISFNSRLLYDTVLNELAEFTPEWEEGCANWGHSSSTQGHRFNENLDSFLHGLRAVQSSLAIPSHADSRDKSRENGLQGEEPRLIIMIERVARLKESMPELLVPLARLAELSRTDVTTLFISDVSWEEIKPSLGAAPDPYFMEVEPFSKQATINRLASLFTSSLGSNETELSDTDTYHRALQPLYVHFLSTLYSVCSPFTTDPDELAYIAAARWPGFVRPILDDHHSRECRQREDMVRLKGDHGEDSDENNNSQVVLALQPPTEDIRIRLTRLFTQSMTAAMEALYPRLTSAHSWAQANVPPPDLLSLPPRQLTSIPVNMPQDQDTHRTLKGLPRMAKFILIASYIASNNPAKTDMRMFGRGRDERKRKRKGGSPRKTTAKSTAVKIPQRLLGPTSFPLDRMIAILGVLLEENDADVRPAAPEYSIPGEYTEMEISKIAVFAQVMELVSAHLLYQTSPRERLDTSPALKCGIGFEEALSLARELGVTLTDILWDPV